MLIKVQCVIYQWIRLDELYTPMGSFLQILNSFLNYWPKTENIQMNSEV